MSKVTFSLAGFTKLEKPVATRGRGMEPEKGLFVNVLHPPKGSQYMTFSRDSEKQFNLVHSDPAMRLDIYPNPKKKQLALVFHEAGQYTLSYAAMNKAKQKSGFKISHKVFSKILKGRYRYLETQDAEIPGTDEVLPVLIFQWEKDLISVERKRKNPAKDTTEGTDTDSEETEEVDADEEESDEDSEEEEVEEDEEETESDDEDEDSDDDDDDDDDEEEVVVKKPVKKK